MLLPVRWPRAQRRPVQACMRIRINASLGLPKLARVVTLLTSTKGSRPMPASSPPAGCLFCQSTNAELNKIVADNKTCYARWDNFPASDGHLEIVPKRHVVSFFELTPEEVQDAYALMVEAREAVAKRWNAQGYTIGVNEGRAAGRTVDHLHIHLIPRYFGDVPDPRGGVRRILPDCDPDSWAKPRREPVGSTI
ncbi:HIT family protein [Micromonospora musae]|uniref:HIT family protein n=1 Tax=Micromonospora musae TaxID=1894970 RepID=UPI00340A44A5